MVSQQSRLFVAALALCAFSIIPACKCSFSLGGGSFSQRVEQFLVKNFSAQGVTSASCPADVEPKTGNKFECTGKNNKGQTVTFAVTSTDDKDGVDATITAVQ